MLGPWEGEGEVWSTLLVMVDFCTSLRLQTCFEGFANSGTISDSCCCHRRGPRQLLETARAFILLGCIQREILHFEARIIQPAPGR